MSEPTASAEEDWGAALAEQKSSVTAPQVVDSVQPADIFQKLVPGNAGETSQDLDLILDIPVTLTVELGRTKIPIKHILQLAQGSVIELDALAGEPMDVLVNGCLIAQGEVVVVNEKFGIRLTDIVTPSERMRRLNR
ncbi:MAG: flagellar motor switch protein FliN [Burkholderiales bacterium]|jgi:flagellar motor switch protein FliN/FliY|nr:flagellar motor switch protein FliN [Burkholderiales bacterium]MCA3216075.1 flagellar motor switch protein FliN [Burkholderiales bacterium]MCA3224101.1 flagellar motor switch protein FliN [Burkholderiales bacterium]